MSKYKLIGYESKILTEEKLNSLKNKQRLVDIYFGCTTEFEDDAKRIKETIKNRLNIDISLGDASKFWEWRSEQYDAGWLVISSNEEIIAWFVAYVNRWVNDDEEYLAEFE